MLSQEKNEECQFGTIYGLLRNLLRNPELLHVLFIQINKSQEYTWSKLLHIRKITRNVHE